jgi:hypothetical protein
MGLAEKRKIKELTETTLPEREREINEICGAAARYEVDWASFDTFEALNYLDNVSCHRLNMALRGISVDDLGKEALGEGLQLVKLKNVASVDQKSMSFAAGVLEMNCAYAQGLSGAFSDMEIQRLLSKSL